MVTIGCPFCTKRGTLMVIAGLATLMIGAAITQLFLSIVGITLIITAYIVPSSLGSDTCTTSTCSNTPSQPPRREKNQ